jgi:hypothetical protein
MTRIIGHYLGPFTVKRELGALDCAIILDIRSRPCYETTALPTDGIVDSIARAIGVNLRLKVKRAVNSRRG